ncbi:MAG: hypothetical protein QXW88_06715 [Thermofilum sp.]|uniref:Uncharacterized protein n=1 Tax=Thermofilum pendens TaxID=2269 RepID=A0A7C4H0W9_THEPE
MRGGSRTGGARITIENLRLFEGYSLAWFADAAARLTAGRSIHDLNEQLVSTIISYVASTAKSVDVVPVPYGGKDLRMTIGAAMETLKKRSTRAVALPSALSIDFAEYVRTAGGSCTTDTGTTKREVFRASEEVVALACIGAWLTRAYMRRGGGEPEEHGYVVVKMPSQLAPLYRRIHRAVLALTRKVITANLGFFPLLVGVSAAVALGVARHAGAVEIIAKNPVTFEYLRLTKSGSGPTAKAVAKGADTIDVSGLARIVGRSGAAGSIYALLSKCPQKGYGNYRSFLQTLTSSLAMYHFYRQPVYIYQALRLLPSTELQREGAALHGARWGQLTMRLKNLSRLVA